MNLRSVSLTNFVDLSLSEKSMILSWRNNENVRKWMYNAEIISIEGHISFIKELKEEKTKEYYLVSDREGYIGVIYFVNLDIISKTVEFGLYANPDINGKGKILMDAISEYCFERLHMHKIIAEVLIENSKAIHLYHYYGFQKVYDGLINKKKIMRLELKNENR